MANLRMSFNETLENFRSWTTKTLHPDATVCHLPEESDEQPYYDTKESCWVFPGDNLWKSKRAPPPKSTESFRENDDILMSIRSLIIKILHPDATICHLPESKEQPYYDRQRFCWVFPGDDPLKLKSGPPPTSTTTFWGNDVPPNFLDLSQVARNGTPAAALLMVPPYRAEMFVDCAVASTNNKLSKELCYFHRE